MTQPSFSLGVSYWPHIRGGAAPYTWASIDQGAVRDELDQIAELGVDTLRLDLRWDDFQPSPDRLGLAALGALEQLLDAAQERGLRVAAGLFGGSLAGALALPRWATGLRPIDAQIAQRQGRPLLVPADGLSILSGEGYHRNSPRDFFDDSDQRTAQRYLIREVVGNFASHPAIWAWLLAADLTLAREPERAAQAADWWGGLAEAARAAGGRELLGQLSAASLARPATLRPAAISRHGAGLLLAAQPFAPLAVNEPWRAGHLSFLLALVASLARDEQGRSAPIYVGDVGLGLAVAGQAGWVDDLALGRTVRSFLADEERQAIFVEEALTTLYAAGAAGVWLSSYTDLSESTWHGPPLDRAIARRCQGLVSAEGRERPAALAVRAFAARLRKEPPARRQPSPLPIDPERFWRTPREQLAALYAEWQSQG